MASMGEGFDPSGGYGGEAATKGGISGGLVGCERVGGLTAVLVVAAGGEGTGAGILRRLSGVERELL